MIDIWVLQDAIKFDNGVYKSKEIIDEYIDQRIDLAIERLLAANPGLLGKRDNE